MNGREEFGLAGPRRQAVLAGWGRADGCSRGAEQKPEKISANPLDVPRRFT